MTTREFFKIARRVKWIVVREDKHGGAVRRAHGPARPRLCPIAYVTQRVLGMPDWLPANGAMSTPPGFLMKVLNAADSKLGRSWLKRRLGIVRA